MARYAEWNKFIGTLKTDPWGVTNIGEIIIAFEKSAADVIPKGEAAREIFEEIEKFCRPPMPECQPLCIIRERELAELKKKYTEEG